MTDAISPTRLSVATQRFDKPLRDLNSWAVARPVWVSMAAAALVFGIGVATAHVTQRLPKVHDEFSYLLAGETFAAGRITNQSHPFWQHFETFHVLQQPSYMSKYPPGQGLALAAGLWLTGKAIVGVCLVSALAVMSFCWMTLGYLPKQWLVVAAIVIAFHAPIQLTWGQSYWGGGLAFVGGALVLGALVRLKRRLSIRDSLAFAVGGVVLGVSRPFEGLVVFASSSLVLAGWWTLHKPPFGLTDLARRLAPAASVLLASGAGLFVYNWHVTGSSLTPPYLLHEATYGYSPLFLWRPLPAPGPEYNHPIMETFHRGVSVEPYLFQQSLLGYLLLKGRTAIEYWVFFFGLSLTLPWAFLPRIARDKHMLAMGSILIASVAAAAIVPWGYTHYFAPAAPLLLLIVLNGLRHLTASLRRNRLGHWAVRAVLAAHLVVFAVHWTRVIDPPATAWSAWSQDRQAVIDNLERRPGQDLVFVRYSNEHDVHQEWVYNDADIDRAEVVFAREMGERDRELASYFSDRRIWLVEPDAAPQRLVPYAAALRRMSDP